MKNEIWIRDEIRRMNRGSGRIGDLLKSTIYDLELAVINEDLLRAKKIVSIRKSLKINLQSVLDRRKLLKRILDD